MTVATQELVQTKPSIAAPIVAIILIALYAIFLAKTFEPATSEPDDNGYFAQGSLLAQTGRTWFVPESDAQYVGMHWLITGDGKFISRYPPGVAVAVAVLEKIGGFKLAAALNPMLAMLGLIGFYLLLRKLLNDWWAIVGVILLAINPAYSHHALGHQSHMGVTCCVIWGIYFLLLWQQTRRARFIFLAGLVLGCIPSIRYPEALMAIGIAAFVLPVAFKMPRPWRHLLIAIAGAAIPVGALAIRNQLVLGAFWRTGYALTHEQTGFSFA